MAVLYRNKTVYGRILQLPCSYGHTCFCDDNLLSEKKNRQPKTVTFIDGPFYPDESLPVPERKKALRDQCYNAMKARAEENSTYEYIAYRKKEDGENKD